MTNATIQNVMLDRPAFSGEPSESNYRQYDSLSSSYTELLKDPNTYARDIWHEAQRFDVLVDAHRMHDRLTAPAPLAEWERELLAPVDGAPLPALVPEFDQDTEAAFVQAELLGASADQRAKLRAIVTARINAERTVETLVRELASTRQALNTANEDILDGHDPRTMQLFANTGAVADKQGLCSVYDQIARDSLIPTRPELADAGYVGEGSETDYYVQVTVSINVMTSVSVTARSEEEAAEQVDQMSNRDIWDNLDLSNTSHYDIESFETGDVEEAD